MFDIEKIKEDYANSKGFPSWSGLIFSIIEYNAKDEAVSLILLHEKEVFKNIK